MTLDVPERQVLIAMDGEAQEYDHHVLLDRVEAGRWVTRGPNWFICSDDLQGEKVIPLPRNSVLPLEDRPILALDILSDSQMIRFRAHAVQYAEDLGGRRGHRGEGREGGDVVLCGSPPIWCRSARASCNPPRPRSRRRSLRSPLVRGGSVGGLGGRQWSE